MGDVEAILSRNQHLEEMNGCWDQRKSPESKPRAAFPGCSSLTKKMHHPHIHAFFPCSPGERDVMRLQVAIPLD